MNTETLTIILKLQEENTLLKRAINDAILMLTQGNALQPLDYGIGEADWLLQKLKQKINKEQNPSSDSREANKG